MKARFKATFIMPAILAAALAVESVGFAPQKPITDDVFKTGKIRFVPLVTITDEAMGGKAFFSAPYDIAVDARGRILVSDAKENNIKVFDATGAYLKTIGRAGQGPGEFRMLMEVEISKDRICAGEGGRVSLFDAEGAFLKSIVVSKGSSWRAMKALPDGRFLVEKQLVDYGKSQDPYRGQVTSLDLYSAELEFLKTVYRREIRRYKYINEPIFTGLAMPYAPELAWQILPDGKIAIGYSGDYEVEIHDPDKGRLESFRHAFTPVKVTKADQERFFAGLSYVVQTENSPPVVKKGAADYMIKNTSFPESKPPFTRITADAQGRIWVQRSAPRDGEAKPLYDIFTAAGRFIGQIEIDGPAIHPRAQPWPGGFWMIRPSEEGELAVVKLGIEAVRQP